MCSALCGCCAQAHFIYLTNEKAQLPMSSRECEQTDLNEI